MCNSISVTELNKYRINFNSTLNQPTKTQKGKISASGLIYTIGFFLPMTAINIFHVGLNFIVKRYVAGNSIDLGKSYK